MAKICVVGSLNMDLCVETPRIPGRGETILGGGFFTSPGGKGANQAVAAAKLGAGVTMIGCVGGDAFGAQLTESLRGCGVDTRHIRALPGAATGVAVVVLEGRDNRIIIAPGANALLSPRDVSGLEQVIAKSDMLVLQLEIPLETARQAMELARARGVKVLLDPAPAARLSADFLALADVVTPNESECALLTGLPCDTPAQVEPAAKALLRMGVPRVVVTLGGSGVLYTSGETAARRPALPVQVADTTAAGDSFTGALAVALADGADFDGAIGFALAAAALTVTRKGAQNSLPGLEEVTEFIELNAKN